MELVFAATVDGYCENDKYLEQLVAGETSKIALMATVVSKDVLSWFKWERIPLEDQNFPCIKKEKHAPRKTSDHTHPVDVVFQYLDPYLNKRVFFSTDLKSYAASSLNTKSVRDALKSLAKTIDCARVSSVWKERYDAYEEASEIRGLLFAYNHDGEFDKDFYRFLRESKSAANSNGGDEEGAVKTASLPIEANQTLHVLDPISIAFMQTVISDANDLHAEGSFPAKEYSFYYPDLKLHKTTGDKLSRPATVEMITGPFLMIEHGIVKKYIEASGDVEETYPAGYVIYYNRSGSSHYEFMYLFDLLSNLQILESEHKIRIRVVSHDYVQSIRSNYAKAINSYIHDWGFDRFKKERLEAIEFEVIGVTKKVFSSEVIGWERD